VSAMTAVTLIILGYISIAGGCLYIAYLLVMSGHPAFASLAGILATICLIASGCVEVTRK